MSLFNSRIKTNPATTANSIPMTQKAKAMCKEKFSPSRSSLFAANIDTERKTQKPVKQKINLINFRNVSRFIGCAIHVYMYILCTYTCKTTTHMVCCASQSYRSFLTLLIYLYIICLTGLMIVIKENILYSIYMHLLAFCFNDSLKIVGHVFFF